MKILIGKKIEEIILLSIIAIQIFDFIGLLTPDWEFMKKMFSITAILFLIYKINFPKIIFGEEGCKYNGILIITFFIYQIKNIVYFLYDIGPKLDYFRGIYDYMLLYPAKYQNIIYPVYEIRHNSYLPEHCFIIASIMLIILTFYLALKIDYKEKTLMYALSNQNILNSKFGILYKFIITYFVLVSLLLFVFNPFIEWLAWSIESPLLIAGLLFYFCFTNRFNEESTIYKLGSLGEDFLRKIFALFKSKDTLYLGLMAIIGLHILIDVGNFIIPYLTYFEPVSFGALSLTKTEFYLSRLNEGHEPIINLFLSQAMSIKEVGIDGFMNRSSLIWLYLGNIIFILLSLILPIILWFVLYRKTKHEVPKSFLSIFYSSAICFLFAPLFIIKYLPPTTKLVGVDILTKPINNVIVFFEYSVLVGLLIYVLSDYKKIKRYFLDISLVGSLLFLGFYLVQFYYSLYLSYSFHITELLVMLNLNHQLIRESKESCQLVF